MLKNIYHIKILFYINISNFLNRKYLLYRYFLDFIRLTKKKYVSRRLCCHIMNTDEIACIINCDCDSDFLR